MENMLNAILMIIRPSKQSARQKTYKGAIRERAKGTKAPILPSQVKKRSFNFHQISCVPPSTISKHYCNIVPLYYYCNIVQILSRYLILRYKLYVHEGFTIAKIMDSFDFCASVIRISVIWPICGLAN